MTRTAIRAALLLATGLGATPAWAGEVPLYRPAPAWVKPAPPVDAGKVADDAPILLTLDSQDRFDGSEVWSYQEIDTRLATPEVVSQSGTLTFTWQPSKGDLIVHAVEIIRGSERIDVLANGRTLTVIRREQQLEKRAIDGMLTATLPVEGLRVGDILRVVRSTTRRETAFGGQTSTVTVLPQAPFRAGFVRARMLWPKKAGVRWRTYVDGVKPVVTPLGDEEELVLTGLLPKAPDLPPDAPLRYRPLPIVEASSFAGWEALSRAAASAYATKGLIAPGSDLATEVKRIAAASRDPRVRTAAALQLVQDKVRYLFNGMDNGNYVPQTPAQTWSLRYGDCKAKTLLLLAMLHDLGVEAEPVLAHTQMGGILPERLPSAGAFNHVLVRATVNGDTLWLDGTQRGTRIADLADVPPFRHVLPLRPAGAQLVALSPRAPARPNRTVLLDFDQSAGLLLPAVVHAEIRMHGAAAEAIGLARTQVSAERQAKLIDMLLGEAAGLKLMLARSTFAYDEATGEATITADGTAPSRWRRTDGRLRMDLDPGVARVKFAPDRARAAWAAIPVAIPGPETLAYRLRVRLPDGGTGFATEGDPADATPMPGLALRRTVSLKGGDLVVDERLERAGGEIAPADVPAARAGVARLRQRVLTGVAPASVPGRWQIAGAPGAKATFQPLLSSYAAAIARAPDEPEGYLARAQFLASIFDRKAALTDLDKALSLRNDGAVLLTRAQIRRALGQDDAAAEDYRAALAIDPDSFPAFGGLAIHDGDHGRRDAALARVQERIDSGGQQRANFLALKADLLARAGDAAGAEAASDGAIEARPDDAALLNNSCWTRAKLNVHLDRALKDCTRAIELGAKSRTAALDSRALVYFRMGRIDEALADIAAALNETPDLPNTLYVRGLIRRKQGDAAAAARDLAAARLIAPRIDEDYRRMGLAS